MGRLGRWKDRMGRTKTVLGEKVREALASVLPITAIVLVLCFTVAPLPVDVLLAFLAGAVLLILGMGFFTLGAEAAMTPIGEQVGAHMANSRKIWVIVSVSFLIGVVVTISEPDLQVLAGQVPAVPNMVLILAVAAGVGLFLVLALLRMLFGVPLAPMLVFFYMIVFVLALFVPKDFLAVAFDPGGVTTGPMTATFLLPFAMGACDAAGGNLMTDAFGLVALVAMTPLVTIQLMGLAGRMRRKLAVQAVRAEIAKADDCVLYYD